MLKLTKRHLYLATICVCGASSIVQAQPQTAVPAAAPIAAHGAVTGEAAPKSESKSELEEAKIEKEGEDELVTDRPDFTESSEVVRRGAYQFESGVTFESDVVDGARGRSVSAPGSLLRIGLGRRTELRISTDGFQT